jgi:4-amino-4-deoxy-L-arabinose transferase-like glycosyltransferase
MTVRIETEPSAAHATPRQAGKRLDAWILAIVTVGLRIPALLTSRALIFDDAVYGVSAVAMRQGELPFRDMFSSLGPLHLPLVYVFDLIGLRTTNGARLLDITAGIVATLAVYFIGRRLATRPAACLAAAIVTASGSVLWVTAPINGDGTAMAFSLLAFLAALRYRDSPSTRRAVLIGLAVGAGLATKAIIWPVGVPIAIGFATAVAFAVLVALPWGLHNVWAQSFTYHQDAPRVGTYGGNASKVVSTLANRDVLLLVVLAVTLLTFVGVLIARRRHGVLVGVGDGATGIPPASDNRLGRWQPREQSAVLLVAWTVPLVAFLVYEPGLFRAHVAHVVPPLALLVAVYAAETVVWRVAVVAAVLCAPISFVRNESILTPTAYSGSDAIAVRDLRALPAGAKVISDDPSYPWRAGRNIPVLYVDTSYQRIEAHMITTNGIVHDAAARDVCAVLVWGNSHFATLPTLSARLEAEGYLARPIDHRGVLYSKSDCHP